MPKTVEDLYNQKKVTSLDIINVLDGYGKRKEPCGLRIPHLIEMRKITFSGRHKARVINILKNAIVDQMLLKNVNDAGDYTDILRLFV